MKLPVGVREQPGWLFVGLLFTTVGLSYLFGVSESTTVSQVLGSGGLRLWGGFLSFSGVLVIIGTWNRNLALEKLALRLLSLGLLAYMGWVITIVPISRATFVVALCASFAGLSEIRIATIKAVLKPLPAKLPEVPK